MNDKMCYAIWYTHIVSRFKLDDEENDLPLQQPIDIAGKTITCSFMLIPVYFIQIVKYIGNI